MLDKKYVLIFTIIMVSMFVLSDTVLQQEKKQILVNDDESVLRTSDSETVCKSYNETTEHCFNLTTYKQQCLDTKIEGFNLTSCYDIPDEQCRNETIIKTNCTLSLYSYPKFIEDSEGSGNFKEFAEVVDLKSENDSLIISWWNRTVILVPYVKSSQEIISISEIVADSTMLSEKNIDLDEGKLNGIEGEEIIKEQPLVTSLDFKSEIVNKSDRYYFNHTMNSDSYNVDSFGYNIESTNVDCNFKDNSLICDNIKVDFNEAVDKQEITLTSEKVSDKLQIDMTGPSLSYIDPTLTLSAPNSSNLGDAIVDSSTPSTNYGSDQTMKLESNSVTGIKNMYFMFNTTSIPSSVIITSSNLYLYEYSLQTNSTINVTSTLAFNESNITYNTAPSVTLLNQKDIISNIGWQYFDVTNAVKSVYAASGKNVSLALLQSNSSDNKLNEFYSKEHYGTNSTTVPYLEINYEYVDTNITGCGVYSTSGVTYHLRSNIVNSVEYVCIQIWGNNITLDCHGKTVDGFNYIGSMVGIWSIGNNNIVIKNCPVTNWGTGIWIANGNNITLINSTSRLNQGFVTYIGIYIANASNVSVYNTSSNDNEFGFAMAYSTNNLIINNSNATNNLDGTDFYVEDVQTPSFDNSVFSNFTGTGSKQILLINQKSTLNSWNNNYSSIVFYKSDNSTINNFTFMSTKNHGMLFVINSTNLTITNSTFLNTTLDTINSNNVNIYNNLFNASYFKTVGTYNWNTSRRVGTRKYSSGPNVGGNYYSDLSNTGYSDTCTDLDYDGFCDSSYSMTTDNYDYIPLSDDYDLIPPIYNNTGSISGIKYGSNVIFSLDTYDNLSNLSSYIFSWNGSGIYYQENATSSSYSGTNWQNPMSLVDNNWTSYLSRTNSMDNDYYYLNYTRVNNSFSAIWQIKDWSTILNVSIPASCFKQDKLQLRLHAYLSTMLEWNCFNYTDWINLRYYSVTRGYEEAIYWNKTGIWTNDTSASLSGKSSSISITKKSYAKRNETICGKLYIYDRNGNLNESGNICYTPENTGPTFDNGNFIYSIAHNQNVNLKMNATDVDEDVLIYGINNTGFTINSSTGLINKTNSLADTGVYYVKVNVTDGFNNSYNETTITINITNNPPSVSSASLYPPGAVDDDNLTCNNGVVLDVDLDSTYLIYDWIRNGTSTGINNQNLTKGNTSINDLLKCSLTPTDGNMNGTVVYSGEVLVGTGWTSPMINSTNKTTTTTGITNTITTPTNNNSWINMSVNFWDYNSGDKWKAYFCKTNDATESGCVGGEFCSINTYTSSTNLSCRYDLYPSIETTYNFYVYVVDNTSLISGVASNMFFINYPPSLSAIVSPISDTTNNYTNVEFIATDANSDLINYTMYGANSTGIYNQLYSGNISQYVWENLSQGTYHLKSMTTDKYGYSLLVNSSVYDFIVDWTPPNIQSFSTSTLTPDATTNVRFYITLNDTYTYVNSDACIVSLIKSDYNSGNEFNLTATSSKVGDQVSILQTMYSYGIGQLNWTKVYCQDKLGNLVMNNSVNISLTISLPNSGSTNTGGSVQSMLVREAQLSTNLTGFCGDQVCQNSENPANCWQDCRVNYDTLVTCIWDKEKECNWSQNWFPMTILLILAITGIVSIYVYQLRNRKI